MRRLAALACVVVLLGGATAGCGGSTGSNATGYGAGRIKTLAASERAEPVDFSGTDLDGEPLKLSDYRGKPVVVVVWGSWCVDCRTEAPDVQAAAEALKGTAQFVGIDFRDNDVSPAQAYVRKFGVDYPSFYSPGGEALLAFPGTLSPVTIPAFVILDAQGRVAASIISQLPSKQTLIDLTEDVASGRDDSGADSGSDQ